MSTCDCNYNSFPLYTLPIVKQRNEFPLHKELEIDMTIDQIKRDIDLLSDDLHVSIEKKIKPLRKRFTPEEDQTLTMLVRQMGTKRWNNIARFMPGRTGRQCRDRYHNYLIPGVFKGQWTREEDDLLLFKYKELGPRWTKMSTFFQKRNANSLKNRWNYFISKHLGDNKTINISNILLEVHEEKEKSEKLEKCSDIISNENQSQSQSFFDISSDIDELDMQDNGFFDFKDDCSEFTNIF